MKYRVTIEIDEDGKHCVSCPALPGCHSCGDTQEAALANIKEAIELYLESLAESGDPVPSPVIEAVVDVDLAKTA